ncbi:hypothetical protein P4T20_13765 [Aneurinibacillus thermoaerophilus]|jgi:CRISPR type IV-associated protein Csf3|uniref:hypothetical protein n=1 Tax=Aneurinibacillus thermoaerophilus TaxID=143495 RepID=UPI002E1D531A|nr:hypothetical protein [Aneurinibacillus thermoaerophilus]
MMPLKVICHLLDGRVNSADGLFMLDSILAYAWMTENHPDILHNSCPGKDGVELIHPTLPLQWRGAYWAASAGFYIEYGQGIEYWHRRPNDTDAARYVDFQGKRGKIETKSGFMKAYRMPQIIRTVSSIEFYAVGDKKEVSRLLNRYITNIGKKGAQGYGAVREWEVIDWPEDWSEKGPYGIMRPTPFRGELPSVETYQVKKAGVRPPYWLPENQEVCIIPNVRRNELAQSTAPHSV